MMGSLAAMMRLSVALAGCQGVQRFLPRDETPVFPPAFAVDVPRGPSTQRLDEDGYPLLGAFPSTAAAQATPEAVSQTQARYANVGTRAAADPSGYGRSVSDLQGVSDGSGQTSDDGDFQRRVDELSAIAQEQQRRAAER